MITAPDIFTIEEGLYTPEIAVDWFTDPALGTPWPLFIGRTLRYSETKGWEVAGASAGAAWKNLSQAPKTVKAAFEAAEVDKAPAEGYYELVGPKLAGNPHGLDDVLLMRHGHVSFGADLDGLPRASLYAWPTWLRAHGAQGVLWIDDSGEETRYGAIRLAYFAPE